LRQHLHVNRFDLVRQGANTGKTDGKLAVVSVGEPGACGFHQEAQLFGIGGLDHRLRTHHLARKRGCLLQREDRFIRRSIS